MLDNPEAMLALDHSDLKEPCRATCPVKVGSTPANCPPLEPGASCAVGHQVSRGHADGHTHELRGCHHAGREFMCWGRQRRVGPPLTPPTAHLCGGLSLAPTKRTNREMCPTCSTNRLASSPGAGAQPPCTTTTYSCASAPQSLSVHADHAAHAVADAEHPRLSSLALEARLGPTSATLRSAHKQSSAMCSEVVLVARHEVVAVCAAGVGRSPKVVPKWCQSYGGLFRRPY